MQTECPNCHTVFRVTETQLHMADGMVRCGFCEHVFNAGAENDAREDQQRANAFAKGGDQNHREPTVTLAGNELENDLLADDTDDELAAPAADEAGVYGQGRTYSTAATVAWSLAILALIATLAAEYIWFNQPELLQHQRYRLLTEKLCTLTDCDHLQKRDPSQIEMIGRNIYTHPNEKDALMISTTLVNQAPYAQPYPDIQVDFSNVRGRLVASRRFLPGEYLPPGSDSAELLQAGSQFDVALEIRDPGQEAITYEFSFH